MSCSPWRPPAASRWAAIIDLRPLLAVALWALAGCASPHGAAPGAVTAAGIQADVNWLADDARGGRWYRSIGGWEASAYIKDAYEAAGLQPLPGCDSIYLPTNDPRDAPNVAAMWPGSDDTYVMLIAHYDHLRPRGRGEDRIFNGADDNASGTAALLAIARWLQANQPMLEASIVLVSFTGEEAGFVGSRHFADNPPFSLERVRGLINLDMISRGERDLIFLVDGPGSAHIDAAIERANADVGLRIVRDQHADWLRRGDQAPFIDRGVPCVFLSVEDHEDYHKVTDHADRIIAGLAADTTRLALGAALELAGQSRQR